MIMMMIAMIMANTFYDNDDGDDDSKNVYSINDDGDGNDS